jgi:hypothetical protein
MNTLSAPYAGGAEESEVLHRFWKPDGSVDRDNERRLKNWLSVNGLDPQSITFFLRNQLFADARKRAVESLGLSK